MTRYAFLNDRNILDSSIGETTREDGAKAKSCNETEEDSVGVFRSERRDLAESAVRPEQAIIIEYNTR
jgi:hypothetical protein